MIVFFNMISFLIQAIGHDFDNDDYHWYQFSIYFVHIETLTPVPKKKKTHPLCVLTNQSLPHHLFYPLSEVHFFQNWLKFKEKKFGHKHKVKHFLWEGIFYLLKKMLKYTVRQN